MNKSIPLNISTLIAFTVVVYLAYYLLLHDNCLHSSISSIIHYAHHLAIKQHVLILGLLPIYIAAMIFGAALLGVYLGERLNLFFIRTIRHK